MPRRFSSLMASTRLVRWLRKSWMPPGGQLLALRPALRRPQAGLRSLPFQRHPGPPGVAGLVEHLRQIGAVVETLTLPLGQIGDQPALDEHLRVGHVVAGSVLRGWDVDAVAAGVAQKAVVPAVPLAGQHRAARAARRVDHADPAHALPDRDLRGGGITGGVGDGGLQRLLEPLPATDQRLGRFPARTDEQLRVPHAAFERRVEWAPVVGHPRERLRTHSGLWPVRLTGLLEHRWHVLHGGLRCGELRPGGVGDHLRHHALPGPVQVSRQDAAPQTATDAQQGQLVAL
jgi:hypothetical protein